MTAELFHRLARAMDVGDATLDQRDRIVEAAQSARTFDELPADIQQLVVALETPPS